MLEQLLSKEVADVSAPMPESVEELRKVVEEQFKQLEGKNKVIEDQRKENQALARRIKELEALASKQ